MFAMMLRGNEVEMESGRLSCNNSPCYVHFAAMKSFRIKVVHI